MPDIRRSPSNVANKQNYADWRAAAADALAAAGMTEEADSFRSCGDESAFRHVDVCEEDLDHAPRVIPYTCHKRYCQDCEAREQARKLLRYVPAMWDAINDAPDRYTVKKFELTTPYKLDGPDAAADYRRAWKAVNKTIALVFRQVLKHDLTDDEKRRGRADLRQHHVGVIASAEFGETTQHLHFHLLTVSPFIPKNLLTETWKKVTDGECQITYIRKIEAEDLEDAIKEQVKYCTKFSALPPTLLPQLASVMQGAHRVRLYGVFRKLPKVDRQPNVCVHCEAKRKRLTIGHYISEVEKAGKLLDDNIMRAYEKRFAPAALLDLKHGNCVGERSEPTIRGSPDPPPIAPADPVQTALTGLDWQPPTRKFSHHDYQ